MRVLYLVPPGEEPGQIARYSFLDEEIEGLVAAGVEAYVPSISLHEPASRDGVHMLPLRVGRKASDLLRAITFMARHAAAMPLASLLNTRRMLYAIRIERSIAALVREHHVDLIHSHFGGVMGFGGTLASRATGTPLVVSFRGMDLLMDRDLDYGLRRDRFYDRGLRTLLRQMEVATFASDFMRDAAIRLDATPEKTVVLPKGVDLSRFHMAEDREALRAGLGIDTPMILTVAGLIPRKGIDIILQALALLRDSHDFTFVVCGEGPEEEELRGLAGELGLGDRTRFVGRVDRSRVMRFFAACDVFVLASRLEAAGNVLLEAMASGRPVICTDSGGPPEYVRHGETGLVVPVDDPAALADGVRILLEDGDLRERYGREGRSLMEREHPYDRLMAGYLDVYRRATGSGAAVSPPVQRPAARGAPLTS
jgi:glycosyltransferase involved in cell wall biosynthesis